MVILNCYSSPEEPLRQVQGLTLDCQEGNMCFFLSLHVHLKIKYIYLATPKRVLACVSAVQQGHI